MIALSLFCSLQWLTRRFSRATPLNPYQPSCVCVSLCVVILCFSFSHNSILVTFCFPQILESMWHSLGAFLVFSNVMVFFFFLIGCHFSGVVGGEELNMSIPLSILNWKSLLTCLYRTKVSYKPYRIIQSLANEFPHLLFTLIFLLSITNTSKLWKFSRLMLLERG